MEWMKRFFLIFFSLTIPFLSSAQRNYPPKIEGATELVYKKVGDVELKLWVFKPEGASEAKSLPGIVFFFGGGWKSGSPEQFVPQSNYLAKRGMIAAVADYRVASRHKTKAKDCVADARDAMIFLRENAAKLGLDPKRLAAGGGSAGGHIAACLGTIEKGAESKPDALALFNPATVMAPFEGKEFWKSDRSEEFKERMGVDPIKLSPIHHITAKTPPCILFHGTADPTVPFETAKVFALKMLSCGAQCDLMAYEGAVHGFFNAHRKSKKGEPAFPKTMDQLDAFFVKMRWLKKE